MRRRIDARIAENHSTARMTIIWCHGFGSAPGSMNCQMVTTRSDVATITSTPGHHAQKPAKKPQNGPSAFCVQTYSEPSCGNINPSCAVTSAPGIRKSRKPRIQNVYADGPARWIADAFTMNRTIATKMIVMSAEFRTRGSIPGAMRSEIIWRSSAGAAAAIHHLRVEKLRELWPHRQLSGKSAAWNLLEPHARVTSPQRAGARTPAAS